MPPILKVDEIVKRKITKCSILNATVTGRIVEVYCQNKLFVKVLWNNNTVPTLELKRNIQRDASVVSSDSPPKN